MRRYYYSQTHCNKCDDEIDPNSHADCWFCGPVCENCAISCFENNEHSEEASA